MCTDFDVLSNFILFCCKISLLCDLRCFVAKSVLSRNLFCREICFVAIYALWRGEKLDPIFCLWRKKDKYQVWAVELRNWSERGRSRSLPILLFLKSEMQIKERPSFFK